MSKKKIIDLSSKSAKNLGEEIQCTDENDDENCITTEMEEDNGEIISIFNEDTLDLSGDIVKTFTFNDENQAPLAAAAKMFKITADNVAKGNADSSNIAAETASEDEAAADNYIKSASLDSSNSSDSKSEAHSYGSSPKYKAKAYGMTTPVNGEAFSIKRGYQFRPSTIKKLTEIKANSDNINIYYNEIIDAAICYYYDAVFNNK